MYLIHQDKTIYPRMNEGNTLTLKLTEAVTLKMLSSTSVADNTKHNPKVIYAGNQKSEARNRLEATTYSPLYRYTDLNRPGRDTGHIPAKRGKRGLGTTLHRQKSVHIAPRTDNNNDSILQFHSWLHIPSSQAELISCFCFTLKSDL